ncbi:aldose 1-epimerase [Sanguibacter suaedae]|uniref:Aldose 1-epimerase n=1 Tax=Sanguibacter suaedae TaxID=2795737 RepID=A0A934I6C8_9MICO|nr:aldose 1-epimerase [Sanguibacter suaedae]MBI9116103.1 aldose 1-epimerase [Sanguibacter suaedae]
MTTLNTPAADAVSSVADGTFGELPTKILQHASGARAEILVRGATVLSWQAPWHGRTEHLIDGYDDDVDFATQRGGRSAVLFPFANRLRDNRYTFDGTTHEVGLQFPVDKEVIHGSARMADWTVVEESASAERVSVTFAFSIRPDDVPGYPFALDATLRFELTATSLDLLLTYRNVGETDAPVAAGWHPYFQVPGHTSIDTLSLRVPARAAIVTDETLVPLPGDAAYAPMDDDLVHETLDGVVYDHAWDRLELDEDGRARTLLTDPTTGEGVAVWQERGTLLVFTGDVLSRPRRSAAIEPLETMTDAFNRSEREADVRVRVGEEKTFAFGAEVVLNG